MTRLDEDQMVGQRQGIERVMGHQDGDAVKPAQPEAESGPGLCPGGWVEC
jgi:hypothetical protein